MLLWGWVHTKSADPPFACFVFDNVFSIIYQSVLCFCQRSLFNSAHYCQVLFPVSEGLVLSVLACYAVFSLNKMKKEKSPIYTEFLSLLFSSQLIWRFTWLLSPVVTILVFFFHKKTCKRSTTWCFLEVHFIIMLVMLKAYALLQTSRKFLFHVFFTFLPYLSPAPVLIQFLDVCDYLLCSHSTFRHCTKNQWNGFKIILWNCPQSALHDIQEATL